MLIFKFIIIYKYTRTEDCTEDLGIRAYLLGGEEGERGEGGG